MKIEEIQKLIEMVEKAKIEEFKYKSSDGGSIYISKNSKEMSANVAPQSIISTQSPIQQEKHVPESKKAITTNSIDSPIIGTFYRSPTPEAKAYVTVGQSIQEGDIIGIIEAMKIMNQIRADKSGVVKSILVDNGQPVEYAQPIIELE